MESMSFALEGRFLHIVPPGKPYSVGEKSNCDFGLWILMVVTSYQAFLPNVHRGGYEKHDRGGVKFLI